MTKRSMIYHANELQRIFEDLLVGEEAIHVIYTV